MELGTARVQCVVTLEHKYFLHYFNIIFCETKMVSHFYKFLVCLVKPYFYYLTSTMELQVSYIIFCHV